MPLSRPKLAWLGVIALSGVALAVSVKALSTRIADWQASHKRPLYYCIRTAEPSFTFAGRPINFTWSLDDDGRGDMTLTIGPPISTPTAQPSPEPSPEPSAEPTAAPSPAPVDTPTDPPAPRTLTFPVAVPNKVALPGLVRFQDWMQVYFFAENADREPIERFNARVLAGEIPLRLAVVTRTPSPGGDRDTLIGDLKVPNEAWGYGETMRNRWSFTFREILRDGTIATETLRFPESGTSFYRRQVRAEQRGEPAPVRAADELKEDTWQWDLALRGMPRPPAITHENQALRNAGWTLPVASLATLGLAFGTAFLFAPPRRRGEPSPITPPAPSAAS